MAGKRIYFLDNLKAATIMLIVVFHAALAYMIYAPEWWYVLDTERVLSADFLVIWADVFIMPIMFFVSGYFGIMSLSKRSMGAFWHGKWKRIILPWLIGAIFLAPQTAYVMIQSRNVPMSFWDFYQNLFWGPYYQQSQYWYLGALVALYILLAVFSLIMPSVCEKLRPAKPSAVFLFLVGAVGAVGIGTVNAYVPDGTWIHPLYLLVLQPTRVPLYLIYFALGVYAWRRQWFSQEGYEPQVKFWLPAFIVLSVVYVADKLFLRAVFQPTPMEFLLLDSTLHSFFCLSAIFGALSFFQAYLDHTGRVWGMLAAISYPVYYIHQTVVQELNWAVRPLAASAFVKYAIVCVLALLICIIISKYILLRLPCFAQRKKVQPVPAELCKEE